MLLFDSSRWNILSADSAGAGTLQCEYETHNRLEILFAISGSYDYFLNGTQIRLTPGTVLLIPPGTRHESQYHTGNTGKHLWCYPSDHEICGRLLTFGDNRRDILLNVCQNIPDSYQLNHLCMQFIKTPEPDFRLKKRLELTLMLTFDMLTNLDLPSNNLIDQRDSAINLVKLYIKEHMPSGINIDHLAQETGYSRFHLVRMFKQHTGYSIQEWLNQCRLQELNKLNAERAPGKEIAEKLGFKTISGFYHWRAHLYKTGKKTFPAVNDGKN